MPCFAGSIQYKNDYAPLPACIFLSLCLWAPPCTEYQEYRFCDRFVSYLQNCIFYSEVCYCILLFFLIVRFSLLFESPRHIYLFISMNLSRLVALVHSSAFATSSRWLSQDFWGLHNSTRQVFCLIGLIGYYVTSFLIFQTSSNIAIFAKGSKYVFLNFEDLVQSLQNEHPQLKGKPLQHSKL